jgi:hypothetical protein
MIGMRLGGTPDGSKSNKLSLKESLTNVADAKGLYLLDYPNGSK